MHRTAVCKYVKKRVKLYIKRTMDTSLILIRVTFAIRANLKFSKTLKALIEVVELCLFVKGRKFVKQSDQQKFKIMQEINIAIYNVFIPT